MSVYDMPKSWSHFVGLEPEVAHSKNVIRKIRIEQKIVNASTFYYGPPGTGKTAIARMIGQCLLCTELDPQTLDPCQHCGNCKDKKSLEGNDNIQSRLQDANFYFSPLDCSRLSADQLADALIDLKSAPGIYRIVHLEEAGCLGENAKDLSCLVPMEDRNFIWIATGMSLEGLSPAFLRRFPKKFRMPLPDAKSLAIWLAGKCKERGIECANVQILLRLAERAGYRAGYALQVLDIATTLPSPEVTMEMVEEHIFDLNE